MFDSAPSLLRAPQEPALSSKRVAHLRPRPFPLLLSLCPSSLFGIRGVRCVKIKFVNPGPRDAVPSQPGEERRTHQWSFKPSAATVLSHAAVFLPAGSRYVGVQQGSNLVSWREAEQDVKRPLSCQVCRLRQQQRGGCTMGNIELRRGRKGKLIIDLISQTCTSRILQKSWRG